MKRIKREGFNCTVLSSNIKNDCTTRTFAFLFFKDDYEKAEAHLKEVLGKEEGRGIGTDDLHKYLTETESLKQKEIIGIGTPEGDVHVLSTKFQTRTKKRCKITVKEFLIKFPKGSYFISVRNHVFAIKDGEIFGNLSDAQKPLTRVERAFQIKWK